MIFHPLPKLKWLSETQYQIQHRSQSNQMQGQVYGFSDGGKISATDVTLWEQFAICGQTKTPWKHNSE